MGLSACCSFKNAKMKMSMPSRSHLFKASKTFSTDKQLLDQMFNPPAKQCGHFNCQSLLADIPNLEHAAHKHFPTSINTLLHWTNFFETTIRTTLIITMNYQKFPTTNTLYRPTLGSITVKGSRLSGLLLIFTVCSRSLSR